MSQTAESESLEQLDSIDSLSICPSTRLMVNESAPVSFDSPRRFTFLSPKVVLGDCMVCSYGLVLAEAEPINWCLEIWVFSQYILLNFVVLIIYISHPFADGDCSLVYLSHAR